MVIINHENNIEEVHQCVKIIEMNKAEYQKLRQENISLKELFSKKSKKIKSVKRGRLQKSTKNSSCK